MKRTETNNRGKKTKKTLPKKALNRGDLGVVPERIANLVGNRAVEMVETTMDEVGKGHYLAMKYLFELVGLCRTATSEGALEDDSLAKILLRRLKLPVENETEVTKDSVVDAAEQVSDAVK